MAGRSPARTSWQDKLPPSPLGATPRPHLRQSYPKPPESTYLSEFQLSQSVQSDYGKVQRSSATKTSYTLLRSQQNSLDKVDAIPDEDDYYPPPPSTEVGSSKMWIAILTFIFIMSLVAVALVYAGQNLKSQG